MLGDEEPNEDMLRILRAKDDTARNLQSSLESERRQRRLLQAEASAERASLQERFRQVEDELQQRLQTEQAHLEEQQKAKDEENTRLRDQLEKSRHREAELLIKNNTLADDVRRLLPHAEGETELRKYADALAVELAEAQNSLKIAEEIRCGLLREAKEQTATLERVREELRELHVVERASRENHQAQYERLNAQCEASARQAQDGRDQVLVLEQRCQRLEERETLKTLESERALKEADERRREVQARLDRAEEEASASRDELHAKALAEAKLREAIAGLHAQIEDHKTEEQRLRQELFRMQAASDEKSITIEAAKNREMHLRAEQATMEERLQKTIAESEARQTQLMSERAQCQTLELKLQGSQAIVTALREEIASVRASEDEKRLELARRLEQQIGQRDAELVLLQNQLGERRQELCGKRGEIDQIQVALGNVRAELAVAHVSNAGEVKSRDEAIALLQRDLVESRDRNDKADAILALLRRDLDACREDLARNVTALTEAQGVAEANAVRADALQEKLNSWRPPVTTEESAQTIPCILPPVGPWFSEGHWWSSEMAALQQQVESLQAMANSEAMIDSIQVPTQLGVPTFDPTVPTAAFESVPHLLPQALILSQPAPQAPAACILDARRKVSQYMDKHHRRLLLSRTWQSWCIWASLQSQVDLLCADECQIARECHARDENFGDVFTPEAVELTAGALKRLLLEFRMRLAAATEAMGIPDSGDSRTIIAESMERGRRSFGRIFHAAMFLYQKLRAFVPSELQEALNDPLSKVVPFPFYVLPYKAQHAMQRGLAAISQTGRSLRISPRGSQKQLEPLGEIPEFRAERLRTRIAELEEQLPLAASSPVAVPHFLSHLLKYREWANTSCSRVEGTQCACGNVFKEDSLFCRKCGAKRPEVDQEESSLRDRFDVLLADAFTVYMSAWRNDQDPGARPSPPFASLRPNLISEPRLPQHQRLRLSRFSNMPV